MQVDLFDDTLLARAKRQKEQIASRGYDLMGIHRHLDGLEPYFKNKAELEEYRNHIFDLIKAGRYYEKIASASCDSLFEVEALGVAKSAQAFVMICDFSECLDYVLHRAYHCKIDDIRKIEGYDEISRSILNNDFSLSGDVKFDRLLNASQELRNAFAELSKESEVITSCEERLSWVIFQFYKTVLSTLSDIKYYVALDVCQQISKLCGQKGIIRSVNYSSVLATVSTRFDEVVNIHQLSGSFDDYQIVFRTYRPYEYVGEVLRRNDFARKM